MLRMSRNELIDDSAIWIFIRTLDQSGSLKESSSTICKTNRITGKKIPGSCKWWWPLDWVMNKTNGLRWRVMIRYTGPAAWLLPIINTQIRDLTTPHQWPGQMVTWRIELGLLNSIQSSNRKKSLKSFQRKCWLVSSKPPSHNIGSWFKPQSDLANWKKTNPNNPISKTCLAITMWQTTNVMMDFCDKCYDGLTWQITSVSDKNGMRQKLRR